MGVTTIGSNMPEFMRDYYKVCWERAACAGTDVEAFYEEKSGVARPLNIVLRKICGGCEIKSECAEFAIKHEMHGFWGGLSPSDRVEIRRKGKR